jgi:hypothetical protein
MFRRFLRQLYLGPLAIKGVLSTLATSSDFLFDGFRKSVICSASLVISLSALPKRGSVLDIESNYFS